MRTASAVESAIAGLDVEDWKQALKQGGQENRKRIAALLEVAIIGHPKITLLTVKARALPEPGINALAYLLSLGARRRGVGLLGDASANPTLEDLRSICGVWEGQCRPRLVDLVLLLLSCSDEQARDVAKEVLQERLQGAPTLTEEAREPIAAAPRTANSDVAQTSESEAEGAGTGALQQLKFLVASVTVSYEALAEVLTSCDQVIKNGELPEGLAAIPTFLGALQRGLIDADRAALTVLTDITGAPTAPVAHVVWLASRTEERLEEESRRNKSDAEARVLEEAIVSAESRLKMLRDLDVPEGHGPVAERLATLASAPPEEAEREAWLSGTVPMLELLLANIRGDSDLASEHYVEVSRLAGPTTLGLLMTRQLSLKASRQRELKSTSETKTGPSEGPASLAPLQMPSPDEPTKSQELPSADSGRSIISDGGEKQVQTPRASSERAKTTDEAEPPAAVEQVYVEGRLGGPDEAGQRRKAITDQASVLSEPEAPSQALRFIEPPLQQVAEPDPTAQIADPARDTSLFGIEQLLARGSYGLASWAARGLEAELAMPLELLALAANVRHDAGPLSEQLYLTCEELRTRPPRGQQSLCVLAAGLLVAAPVAPSSGSVELLETVMDLIEGQPRLRHLAETLIHAVHQGFPLVAHADRARTAASAEKQIADCQSAARVQLDMISTRTLKFPRATRVYRGWLAEDGRLGALLTTVVANDTGRLDETRHAALRLSNERSLAKAIDEDDARLRAPGGAHNIAGDARARLIELAHEILEVVDQWCRSAASLSAPSRSGDHIDVLVTQVRNAADALLEVPSKNLVDSPFEAIGNTAVHIMTSRLAEILVLGPGQDREPEAEEVLDARLPWVYEERLLRRQQASDPTQEGVRGLLVADQRTGEEAYDGFKARLDPWGAKRLVEAVAEQDSEMGGRLLQRLNHDLPSARQSLHRRYESALMLFDELEAYPLALTVEEAARTRALLLEAEEPVVDDLRSALNGIDEVRVVLGRACDTVKGRLREQIACADLGRVDEQAALALLAAGELGAVHERLESAADGGTGNAARDLLVDRQRMFWQEQVEAVAAVGLIGATEALRNGKGLEHFGAGPTDAAQRARNAEALDAWQALFINRTATGFEDQLRLVLSLIGMQPGRLQAPTGKGSHTLMSIESATPALPVVSHEFGSDAAGKYRVVLVWQPMAPDRLVSLVVNDLKKGPHLLFYNGCLTRSQRAALSDEAQSPSAAGNRLLVIDEAVALAMAFHPAPSFAALEHLTLPFAHVSAFVPDVAGNVPPELFQGRRLELAEILDRNGSSFVFGGRQVGKSALLRAAAREVEAAQDPDSRAVYLDLKGLGIGMWRDPKNLWPDLFGELRRLGVLTEPTSHTLGGDAFIAHVRSWLDKEPTRRILVLLDECDDLLDADAKKEFPVIQRLRNLMLITDRRVKVVLAGLHQVQRFERQRNVPLAHLTQQPVTVGPLHPSDAVNLITGPLLALGYELDDAATWRLLARTNYQPGMIQLFGQALLRALEAAPRPAEAPPVKVGSRRVDEVYRSAGLAEQMRRRFMLTIDLDPKYRCIAFAMAQRNLQDGLDTTCDDETLLNVCATYWPAAFAEMRTSLFSGLVDEMAGLGVLTRTDEGVRIRNPNIVRLLGSQAFLEAELLDFESQPEPAGFEASLYRRRLPDGRRSPLTEEELSVITEDNPRLVLIGGTPALGLHKVTHALDDKLYDDPEVDVNEVEDDEVLDTLRQSHTKGRRLVAIVNCCKMKNQAILNFAMQVQEVLNSFGSGTGMRRVVLLLGAAAYPMWSDDLPSPTGLELALRLGLRRLTMPTLDGWAGEENLELPPRDRANLLRVTGGWPSLIDEAVDGKPGRSWEAVLKDLELSLSKPDRASRLIADVVDGSLPGQLGLDLLAELGDAVTWSEVEELGGDNDLFAVRGALTALRLTDVRDSVISGDSDAEEPFALEQVLMRASRCVSGAMADGTDDPSTAPNNVP